MTHEPINYKNEYHRLKDENETIKNTKSAYHRSLEEEIMRLNDLLEIKIDMIYSKNLLIGSLTIVLILSVIWGILW